MQLTYRGVQYIYKPTILEVKDTFETGKYRGVDIRFRTVKQEILRRHKPLLCLNQAQLKSLTKNWLPPRLDAFSESVATLPSDQ